MKINRENEDFYKYMGEVFGSRQVQRETKDRFYDDPGKDWIIHIDKNKVDSAISVKEGMIKNVYSKNKKETIKSLTDLYNDVKGGIVPAAYIELYEKAGYEIKSGQESKNFVEVKGGKNEY